MTRPLPQPAIGNAVAARAQQRDEDAEQRHRRAESGRNALRRGAAMHERLELAREERKARDDEPEGDKG